MSLPRWDDEMKFELLRLKSELKVENFRVLHQPLGLGRVTKKTSEVKMGPPLQTTVSELRQHAIDVHAAKFRSAASSSTPTHARPSQFSQERRSRSAPNSFSRFILVHALDVGFVLLSIAFGVLLAIWVIDPKHLSENPQLLRQSLPLQFLMESNAFALVIGLYAFFSLYWLFFKFVTGSTLGESFLNNFWSLQNPRKSASVKDSGDS